MKKLIIHHPQNFESRGYRYYNKIFNHLIKALEHRFDVMHTGYYKYANQGYCPLLLLSDKSTFDSPNIQMLECEMVIENPETQEIKALSVSDNLTSVILNLAKNSNTTKILVAQYNKNSIKNHLHHPEKMNIYSPWVYFPQNIENYDKYYEIRQKLVNSGIGNIQDKFYFRGTSLEYRNIINYFQKDLFSGGAPIGNFDTYANDLLQYKMGYSIAGRGEFCYRDVEYMAMGIPFIRFEYTNEMCPKLVPNYHYISVDRPEDLLEDKNATPEHAKLIEQKFLEVKDNKDYLKFVSKNAREYYERYINIESCVNHTLQLLDLNS